MSDFERDTVHLVRLALDGKSDDVAALSRRILRNVGQRRPELMEMVEKMMQLVAAGPMRMLSQEPLPVDVDSRLELVRVESAPTINIEPTWPEAVLSELKAVLNEREHENLLEDAGIAPTRSMLFVGPPGVGKTLAAKWLAIHTHRPLLTLDLAAVMSSFLGRTGNNIRVVLDFAKRAPSVLLLDEFDAIAKRRDDSTEIGELKRLVTVLLQEVDEWPSSGILVAATNHPELLDPAVWRRFDRVVQFPTPTRNEIAEVIIRLLSPYAVDKSIYSKVELLLTLVQGRSFADIARILNSAKRAAVVRQIPLQEALDEAIAQLSRSGNMIEKIEVAKELVRAGKTQRDIADMTGLARATIQKHTGGTKLKNSRTTAATRGA